ncbi:MAG: 4Fe-4S binding protein, partial [Planctomycetaceae bacterium]|nr:4Fe-4S binding protein [Planctomycetaceae bacterium]
MESAAADNSPPSPRKNPRSKRRFRQYGLVLFRLGLLATLVWMLRSYTLYQIIQGDAPIELAEVRSILPEADHFQVDAGDRAGLFVLNKAGEEIGYAFRTSPQAEQVKGYAGPTDVLIVMGPPNLQPNPLSLSAPREATPQPPAEPTRKILGIQIRHSWDTKRHIGWVTKEAYFMNFWKGRDWENLADLSFYDEYMEGVSGATLSSMGIARSIQHRVRWSQDQAVTQPEFTWSNTDVGLGIAILIGLLVTFRSGWKGNQVIWTGLKLAAIVYVGFLNGSLLALSLLAGYAAHGIAWQVAPGLTALFAISFLIPITTRKQVYCQQICPHGAAQQLLSRWSPWKYSVPAEIASGLKWIPWFLMAVGISALLVPLPVDLANLEPFDAYLFWQTGWIPVMIAVAGLLISAFVPMAYCKYGCPTGRLLEYVKRHGQADRLNQNDLAACLLVLMTYLMTTYAEVIQAWIATPNYPP